MLSPILDFLLQLLDTLIQVINHLLERPRLRALGVVVFPVQPLHRRLVVGLFLLQLILQVAVARIGESAECLITLQLAGFAETLGDDAGVEGAMLTTVSV